MGKAKPTKEKSASQEKEFVRKVETPEFTQATVLEVKDPPGFEGDVYKYRKELLIKMAIEGPCYDDDFCKGNWHCLICGEGMGSGNSRQLCRKTRCDNQYEIDELDKLVYEEAVKKNTKVIVDSPNGKVKLDVE